uniref:Uncharacterized protein n=1 Tax=viral metagenome TaxID=1070528 RepID=A0A6M3J3A5_9ZZZZ
MRLLPGTQAFDQYLCQQNPVYKVEIKPSEASAEEYEDITSIVVDGSISRNSEAKPNTAKLKVVNTEGIYDIVKVTSGSCKKFKPGAKVRIYLGYGSADTLMFTGYVKEGYDPTYERNKKEEITVTLNCRAAGTEAIDYTENNINSIAYISGTIYQYWEAIGNPGGWIRGEEWTVKRILEHVLITYGGMSIDNIEIDAELNEEVEKAQFVEESLWEIVKLCCQTKMHIGYFDTDGKFKTKPLQFDSPDWDYSTSDGSTTQLIAHTWSTKDLASQVVVTGGINFYSKPAITIIVFNTDPYRGIHTNTAGYPPNGTDMYDALCGDPNASEADKIYGIGHQAFLTPRYSATPGKSLDSSERRNPDNWDKVLQGPFPWTTGGIPNEPHQTIKTGIGDGDDMGVDGYFKKWNMNSGVEIEIQPDTLNCTGDGFGKQYPPVIQQLMYWSNCVNTPLGLFLQWYGILPSKDAWDAHWKALNEKTPCPLFDYPLDEGVYNGPSSTEYYTFAYNLLDALQAENQFRTYGYDLGELWDAYNKVWQWGLMFEAETEVLPSTNWSGTVTDPELWAKYGARKSQNIENPLLFGTTACEFVAAKTIERLKYMSIAGGFNRTLQLELECGDLVDYYNHRIQCLETLTSVQCAYTFGRNKKNLMTIKGGVIRSNGTTLKVWE